jgi:hypothetical protein
MGLYDSPFQEALEDFQAVYVVAEIERRTDRFQGLWERAQSNPPADLRKLLDAVDCAGQGEFGHSILELNQFILAVYDQGTSQGAGPFVVPLPKLIEELTAALGWERTKVLSVFDFLASRPRPCFLTPPEGFEKADIWPWRFNRGLSYIRKPLLVRERSDGSEVVWGNRHLVGARTYFNALCRGGRLKARTLAMRQAMGALHRWDGARFNDAVAEQFERVDGLLVRRRVKMVNGKRLARQNGQILGDIDVLLADPARRELIPIETKDLNAAITPPELRNELDELFGTEAGRLGDLHKFAERVEWIERHREDVLMEMRLDSPDANSWTVSPLVVLDRELISSFIAKSPVTVLSFRRIPEWVRNRSSRSHESATR